MLRTSNFVLAVIILLICKFKGGGDIEKGKFTEPEANILPVPVELSTNDILKVDIVVEVFVFFKR
jgi:hypothetical protein